MGSGQGEMRTVHKNYCEGRLKVSLQLYRHRWKYNIEIGLRRKGLGRYGLNSSGSEQKTVVFLNTVMDIRVAQKGRNFFTC
jgi:hypothetical protein